MLSRALKDNGFPKTLRLIKTEDFGALLRERSERTFRIRSRYFIAQGKWSDTCRLRVGVTVGKANSPRSVDRALVKRIIRESSRQSSKERLESLAEKSLGLDLSIRLCVPLKTIAVPNEQTTHLRKLLRIDVDVLWRRLDSLIQRKLAS